MTNNDMFPDYAADKEVIDGVKFILKNSLQQDNMIVLTPREISLVQTSSLLFHPCTIDEDKEYSIGDYLYCGRVTIKDSENNVLIYSDKKIYV